MNKHTKDLITLRGINTPRLINLVDKLTVSLNYGEPSSPTSIMTYGVICRCDDAFLCEHRLQWIIDWTLNHP
jgi:hypothetical protein